MGNRANKLFEASTSWFYYGLVPLMLFHAYKGMRNPDVICLVAGGGN
eukprot:gene7519-8798_t